MITDFRALCVELIRIADAFDRGKPLASNQGQALDGYSALAAFRAVAARAKAVLAQSDGPAVSEDREPASVTGQPSDEELLRIAAEAIDPYETSGIAVGEYEPETECAVEVYGSELCAYARAVLARWGRPAPAPPADGEVAELAAWLRMQGEAQKPGPNSLLSDRTKNEQHTAGTKLIRAADLLEGAQ